MYGAALAKSTLWLHISDANLCDVQKNGVQNCRKKRASRIKTDNIDKFCIQIGKTWHGNTAHIIFAAAHNEMTLRFLGVL